MQKMLSFLMQSNFSLNARKMHQTFHGKTIVITGASFGIGRQIALYLSEYSTHLILIARTFEQLESLKKEVIENGAQVTIFGIDMRNKILLEEVIQKIQALPIDMVFSNAGKSIRRSIFDSLDRLHDFERTMAINYIAPVQLLLALLPNIIQQKGRIINISTVNNLLLPVPKWSAYLASKSAFDQWFRAVGMEISHKGVKSHSIYLPLVDSRMIKPTKHYDNTPKISIALAAKVSLRTVYKNKINYMPYWQYIAHIFSAIFRNLFERYIHPFIKY